MEHAAGDQGDFFPFGHQCQVLQRCDLLPQSGQRSSLALVLKALMTFKERWHLSRQFLLPFDIGQSTGLCPDVLVEIAKYLSLNDAIHAFSISILSVLRQAHSKIHLNDPSRQFLEIIPDQLDSRQVASVRMSGDLQRSERDLSAFQIFDQLSNLTVVSERGTHTLSQLLRYLPSIRRLSSMPHKVEGRHQQQPLFNENRSKQRGDLNPTVFHSLIRVTMKMRSLEKSSWSMSLVITSQRPIFVLRCCQRWQTREHYWVDKWRIRSPSRRMSSTLNWMLLEYEWYRSAKKQLWPL